MKQNWIINQNSSRTSHFLFTTDVARHFLVTTLGKRNQFLLMMVQDYFRKTILDGFVLNSGKIWVKGFVELFAISTDLVWKSPPSKKCWGYFLIRQFMDTHHFMPLFRTKFNAIQNSVQREIERNQNLITNIGRCHWLDWRKNAEKYCAEGKEYLLAFIFLVLG